MKPQLEQITHHIFLTRDPRKSLMSMMAIVESDKNWDTFDPKECGYDELDKFYGFVTETLNKKV